MLLIVDCTVLNLILKWYWIWVQHNKRCYYMERVHMCNKEIKSSVPKMNGGWYKEAPYAIPEPMVSIAFSGCSITPNSMMEGDDWQWVYDKNTHFLFAFCEEPQEEEEVEWQCLWRQITFCLPNIVQDKKLYNMLKVLSVVMS